MASNPQVVVPVKSAWSSRINWIAAITGAGSLITAFLPFIPQEYQGKAVAAVALLGAVGVWYQRTFQTTSVTPSSVPTPTPNFTTVVTAARNAGLSEEKITDLLNSASRVNP